MKVVGLLSGGKDSCYNLCHCVAQGHDLVAVASLQPEGGKEEIDSYMYQTVGQDGIHYIADALELPLFRRAIRGTAVDQSSDYASTSKARLQGHVNGDETEDLYDLLRDVLASHPDVEGVSVGAILSNYQRVRVEHVCARLGLQALSYLWQYDQSQLLEDMDAAGMQSVIIKVAGAGLGVRHLGQNVCGEEMRDELNRLNAKWGTHPAGEGGEYETFTVDCPLFKKRIELLETEPVVLSRGSSRDDIGTVAYLRIKRAHLLEKPASSTLERLSRIRLPPLLDPDSQRVLTTLEGDASDDRPGTSANGTSFSGELPIPDLSDFWILVNGLMQSATTLEEEIKGCFKQLQDQLAKHNLDLLHVTHVNLELSSMNLFPRVNAVYNTFFGPSPPTRACVAVDLPPGVNVRLGAATYNAGSALATRVALHVRGLSYWAPANIGPYSQAVLVGERLYIAGQIALQPYDLKLPEPTSFPLEAVLSLQHVRRIVKAVQEGTGGGFQGQPESCICWIAHPLTEHKKAVARTAWTLTVFAKREDTPFVFKEATGLPRGAQVEWQVIWQTGRLVGDEDSD